MPADNLFPIDIEISDNLRSIINDLLLKYLQKHNIIQNFEIFELNLINQFNYNSFGLCTKLALNKNVLNKYVNIFFHMLTLDNPSFGYLNKPKTYQQDYQFLLQQVKKNPYLTKTQLEIMLQDLNRYYFSNFEIFNFAINNSSKPKKQINQIFIDTPSYVPPLREAVEFTLKKKLIEQQQ